MNFLLRTVTPPLAVLLASGAAVGATSDANPPAIESKFSAVLGRPGGLTSTTVATRAEATSFDVKAQQHEVEAAAAAMDQAFVGYFPKLSLTARYTRLSPIEQPSAGNLVGVSPNTPAGPVTNLNQLQSFPFSFPVLLNNFLFQATLNVPLTDYLLRISQAYASATKSQQAAATTEKAKRLSVATDARVAYYTWVRAKLQEIVAEQALEQTKAHLVDVQHAFDAGTTSRADVLRIESQVASSQLLLERARNLTKVTETQVRVAMHDPSPKHYEIGETVDAEQVPADSYGSVESLWTEAANKRLEARAVELSAASLHEQAKAARAGNLPRVDAFGDVIAANPNQRIFPSRAQFDTTWDVGVQLTWSPNDVGTSTASGKNLDAKEASLLAQKESLEDGIRVEVTQAINALREAEVSIESSARGLAAAEESYRVRRSLFQNGRATNVELTDAETDLTRARLDAINARVDLRVARVKLDHALGRDVSR